MRNKEMEFFSKVRPNKPIWRHEIISDKSTWSFNFNEIYQYRDLLILLVRRDVVAVYKQTILGPIWFFISPLLSSIIQFFVFGKLAELPSDGANYFIFVLIGNVIWSYFQTSLTSIAGTFQANQGIFGKVYFPRAIMPLSVTISNIFQFIIKTSLIFVFLVYFGIVSNVNFWVFLTPILLIMMALISMGLGMIISALTTKYKDFVHLTSFAVSLFMYVTPVIYPTSMLVNKLGSERSWIIYCNPLTSIIDVFRFGILGVGNINMFWFVYSFIFSIVIYLIGLIVFNRVEKSFMDTI